MRQPPANPFKFKEIFVEEPEIEEEEAVVLPKLPKMTSLPKMDAPTEETIKGNGHNPDADEQAVQDKEAEEKQNKQDQEDLEREREEAENSKIPGSGYGFNVKKKHLPEATRLNEREIFTFGVGAVQDKVLDLNRTESVFEIFTNSIFRLKISLGGKGREEYIAVRQVDAEEKANAVRGGITGL